MYKLTNTWITITDNLMANKSLSSLTYIHSSNRRYRSNLCNLEIKNSEN